MEQTVPYPWNTHKRHIPCPSTPIDQNITQDLAVQIEITNDRIMQAGFRFLSCLLLCLGIATNSSAGDLDRFENQIGSPTVPSKPDPYKRTSSKCDGLLSCFVSITFEGLAKAVFDAYWSIFLPRDSQPSASIAIKEDLGTKALEEANFHRITHEPSPPAQVSIPISRRKSESRLYSDIQEPGSPLRPTTSLDVIYFKPNGGQLNAVDVRAEGGHSLLGLEVRHTQFFEKAADDSLKITYARLLLRFKTDSSSFGLGFGPITVDGNYRNTGFSTAGHFRYMANENIGLLARYSSSTVNQAIISDGELGVSYVRPFYSINLGFRELKAGPVAIGGPMIGLSAFY